VRWGVGGARREVDREGGGARHLALLCWCDEGSCGGQRRFLPLFGTAWLVSCLWRDFWDGCHRLSEDSRLARDKRQGGEGLGRDCRLGG
jgi:hypothetical protein